MNKITAKDLNKYTKDEIIEVLVKYQDTYRTGALLSDLRRFKASKVWELYEEASNKHIKLLNEYTKLLKELKAKNGDKSILKYDLSDINRLTDLNEKINKAEIEEERTYKEYESIYEEE